MQACSQPSQRQSLVLRIGDGGHAAQALLLSHLTSIPDSHVWTFSPAHTMQHNAYNVQRLASAGSITAFARTRPRIACHPQPFQVQQAQLDSA